MILVYRAPIWCKLWFSEEILVMIFNMVGDYIIEESISQQSFLNKFEFIVMLWFGEDN